VCPAGLPSVRGCSGTAGRRLPLLQQRLWSQNGAIRVVGSSESARHWTTTGLYHSWLMPARSTSPAAHSRLRRLLSVNNRTTMCTISANCAFRLNQHQNVSRVLLRSLSTHTLLTAEQQGARDCEAAERRSQEGRSPCSSQDPSAPRRALSDGYSQQIWLRPEHYPTNSPTLSSDPVSDQSHSKPCSHFLLWQLRANMDAKN
jgi:hypothetical protein